MGILEEIYHGNIMFTEIGTQDKEEYCRWSDKMHEVEEKLTSGLLPEQKELFNKYSNAFCSVNAISETEQFMFGFKIGALLMIETFTGADVYLP